MSRGDRLSALSLIALAGLLESACRSTKDCNAGTVMATLAFDATTSAADAVDVYASVDGAAATMTTLPHSSGTSEGSVELYFPNSGGYPTGRRLDVSVAARLGAATLGTATGSILMLPEGCGTLTIALVGNGGPGTGGTTGSAGTTGAAGRGGTTGTAGRGGTTGTAGGGGTTGTAGGGGTTGTAGRGGTSGAAGRGGTTGTAGVTGCGACVTGQTCANATCVNAKCNAGATVPPISALITDFSDAVPDPTVAGDFRFGGGMLNRVQGGTARFSNPASTRGTLTLSNNALTFTATVSAPAATGPDQYPYNGFAIYVDGPACVDAGAYSGVAFILTGNLGTCNLQFSFAYAEILASGSDPDRGICAAASCFASQYMITTSVTSVAFTQTPTVLGMPVSVPDKAKLTGVQIELTDSGTTSCIGSVTITNVRFQ